jgi:parallel beta-helix repeat protein
VVRSNTASGNAIGIRLSNASNCLLQDNHLAGNTDKGCEADNATNLLRGNTIFGGGLTGGTAGTGNVIVP